MKYPWVYVGAKVVCVDNSGEDGFHFWLPGEKPVLDAVYTIAAVGITDAGNPGVQLLEITRPLRWGFGLWRFAPVLPDTTKQVEALSQLVRDAMGKTPEGVG